MGILIRLILMAVATFATAYILPGAEVESFTTAIILAIVLGLLNVIVKPILSVLSLPVTVLTFGLFTLIINGLIILLASKIVPGFHIAGFWWAVLFSIVLTLISSLLGAVERD